jgi:hypothetical protein
LRNFNEKGRENVNATWQAIAREAGLAAEHLGMGVTALGRANYAHHAYYHQAFFALSIGMERAAKLALLVEYAIQHNGGFPDNRALRQYGHDLKSLLTAVNTIATSGSVRGKARTLPTTPIHKAIVDILSEFSSNITRYYNLDLVTNAPGVDQREDPVGRWYREVMQTVIAEHVPSSKLAEINHNARVIQQLMGSFTHVIHHAEDGKDLSSVQAASAQTGLNEAAQPHVRLYVLQVVRFLASVMNELGYQAQAARLDDVPALGEFFAIFNNSDSMLKSRKTWSIYNA